MDLDKVCAIHSSLSPSLLSHAWSSQHPNRRTLQTAFSASHADFCAPPPTSSQTSYSPYKRAKHRTSTTPYFVYFLPGPIRPQSLHVVLQHLKLQHTLMSAPVLQTLSSTKPSVSRSSSCLASDSSPAPPLPPRSSHTHQRSIVRIGPGEQQARGGRWVEGDKCPVIMERRT